MKKNYCFIFIFLLCLLSAVICFYFIGKKLKILSNNQKHIITKLSLKNDIARIGNIKVYVPNYPADYIQRYIVSKKNFYESDDLKEFDKYLPNNAVILDIGANIGNHTLYWLLASKKAKFVYAFEVIDETFNILKKNIELNNLQNKTQLFNFGLSDKTTNGSVDVYLLGNIGGTSVKNDPNGTLKLRKLDDINFDKKVDAIKLDVEGMEISVIKGGMQFIKKHKPLIWVELFTKTIKWNPKLNAKNKKEFEKLMQQLNYEEVCVIGKERAKGNYLFKYKKSNKQK